MTCGLRSTPLPRLVALVCLACVAPSAAAHPAPFSYVDLRPSTRQVDLTVVVHVFDIGHELSVPPEGMLSDDVWPRYRERAVSLVETRVVLEIDGRRAAGTWSVVGPMPDRQSIKLRARYEVDESPGRVRLTTSMFPYDAAHQTFVNVYEGEGLVAQVILGSQRTSMDYFTGTRQGRWALVRRFATAGLHHILIGWDHLLFLAGLLLAGGSLARLAKIVTAFTVAHSLTLSLAVLGQLSPPAGLVEPAIALSIVVVGVDNLFSGDGKDLRTWMAFAFGLLHGFGFAASLLDMGIQGAALGWSLFAFNCGVELGQLALVACVAYTLALLGTRYPAVARRLTLAGSVVVIATGSVWFVERSFFSVGMN